MTRQQRALAFIAAHPETDSMTVAAHLGCTTATASTLLRRLFWAARVDRYEAQQVFRYTVRAPRP